MRQAQAAQQPGVSQGSRVTSARGGRRTEGAGLAAHGQPLVWLTAGMLVLAALMIIGLLGLVLVQGAGTFWPRPVVRYLLADGTVYMGEVTRSEEYEPRREEIEALPAEAAAAALGRLDSREARSRRWLVRTGNYELTGTHFHWVSDFAVAGTGRPEWAVTVERLTWGRFYGVPVRFVVDGQAAAEGPEESWAAYRREHRESRARWRERRRLESEEVGRLNYRTERARLGVRQKELEVRNARTRYGRDSERHLAAQRAYEAALQEFAVLEQRVQEQYDAIRERIAALDAENDRYTMVLETAGGQELAISPAEIVRAYPANALGLWHKLGIYLDRWWEFFTDNPREANSEGGVFPAIFGTVVMTLLMSLAVVPFGVLAALYLREYAKAGPLVSAVRIAINNLAGVPSIVFGVFGLGFFCYIVGGGIDQLFYSAKLPSPTFGTGGLLWASLTLALLTLPVVIVATEEALAAVPSSMREGSYACGASKWQTIRRIVLPRALPGIMTGMILAMARGAGEVAPLMLVGAVKLAPELPLDGNFPFVHLERSFMHLGFHIFDLGFQSQNSEAAKPMVFSTTLLLILVIVVLNLAAIRLRARLRRRFVTSQF